jgi:tetraacyldisaccharide 4'-kinase
MLVTTQKDAVRFPKLDRRDLPVYFMRVEIKIIAGAQGCDDALSRIFFR